MSELRDAPISSTILHLSGAFTVGAGSGTADLRGMFGKLDRLAAGPFRLGIILIRAIRRVVIVLQVSAMRVLVSTRMAVTLGSADRFLGVCHY